MSRFFLGEISANCYVNCRTHFFRNIHETKAVGRINHQCHLVRPQMNTQFWKIVWSRFECNFHKLSNSYSQQEETKLSILIVQSYFHPTFIRPKEAAVNWNWIYLAITQLSLLQEINYFVFLKRSRITQRLSTTRKNKIL